MKKPIDNYLKYLFSTIGSSLIVTFYSLVDAICVGQYHGEEGTASLAVLTPFWTVIFSFGLLFGVGGSTIYKKYRSLGEEKNANSFFTLSLILSILVIVIVEAAIIINFENFFIFLGAKEENILNLCKRYGLFMLLGLPLFLLEQVFSCFIRNDERPLLATVSVILGGVSNIVLDILLVFTFDLGIFGAGLATFLGQCITFLIIITHFFSKKKTLKLVRIESFFTKAKDVFIVGIPSFIVDISVGVVLIVFNNQINIYADNATTVLAICGVIANVNMLFQSLGYAIGQSNQPLLTEAYSLKDIKLVSKYNKYAIFTSLIFGLLGFILVMSIPNLLIDIFIDTSLSNDIFEIGDKLIRLYFALIPLSLLNIYFIYYFQSLIKATYSIIISLVRSLILPLIFIMLLPLISLDMMFLSVAFSELITIIISCFLLNKTKKQLASFDKI